MLHSELRVQYLHKRICSSLQALVEIGFIRHVGCVSFFNLSIGAIGETSLSIAVDTISILAGEFT